MSENSGERKFIGYRDTGLDVGADGSCLRSGEVAHDETVSKDEIREAVAEYSGIDPDKVDVGRDEINARRASGGTNAERMSVGFRKWRSSWEPSGGNPNLN